MGLTFSKSVVYFVKDWIRNLFFMKNKAKENDMNNTLLDCMGRAEKQGKKASSANDFVKVFPDVREIYGNVIENEKSKIKYEDIGEIKQSKSSVGSIVVICQKSIANVLSNASENWEGICKNYQITRDNLVAKYKNFDENRADESPAKNPVIKSFAIIMFFFILEGLLGSFFLKEAMSGGGTDAAIFGVAVSLLNVAILGTLGAHVFLHFRKRLGDIHKAWFMLYVLSVVGLNIGICYYRYTGLALLGVEEQSNLLIFLIMFCIMGIAGFVVSFWSRYMSWKPEDELYVLRRKIHRTPLEWQKSIKDSVEDAIRKISSRRDDINNLDTNCRLKYSSMHGNVGNIKSEYDTSLLEAIKSAFVTGHNVKGLKNIKVEDLDAYKLDDWNTLSLGYDEFSSDIKASLDWWDNSAGNEFNQHCIDEISELNDLETDTREKLSIIIQNGQQKYNIAVEVCDVK